MTASGDFLLADGKDQRPVQVQCFDRRTAGCGASEKARALPVKVVVPEVAPRIEKGDLLTARRIDGGLTRGLAKRARNAGEREVVAGVVTSSFHRHGVVDMKGRFLTELRKAAILTSVAGTPDNQPA